MDEECKQLLMILMGTAGTDKSYTVHAICKMCLELLHPNQQLHLLAAPTGTAAYQINGRTVHALLGLPTKNVTVMSELAPNRKARLEQQWEHIRHPPPPSRPQPPVHMLRFHGFIPFLCLE